MIADGHGFRVMLTPDQLNEAKEMRYEHGILLMDAAIIVLGTTYINKLPIYPAGTANAQTR